MSQINAYPLQWPQGFPRWKQGRVGGQFKTTFDVALRNVRKSLELFAKDSGKQITDPVLSSNVDFNPLTINTGKKPTDPGVAVWFSWDGLQVCIPVDRYDTPAANLQAIHHIIEARRVELRHGTLALVRATFQGFKALPAPAGQHWRDVLGLKDVPQSEITDSSLKARYHTLAGKAHPDKSTGSQEKFAALQNAYTTAKLELGFS